MVQKLMTTQSVALELRCSAATVRRLIQEGELPAQRLGGRFVVDRTDLLAVLERLASAGELPPVGATSFL